ncbi:hypothetical protein SCLCIDRAFT_142475 [Scleroderma citrinum Foug A]|uniref:HAT C-terminal dimerisation domain-containing protein n=1 Tax=Scleroderma citrinum Foug A TaxID=1036808 RepID=A0A0C3CTB5_9AGAM|nr:hypothetical protein SCLCIDRAFT_142475 [Scleroderma citrinum Foug A]
MAWGGADEQKMEREAGNPNAKDWHDKATKIVEKTMAEYWDQMRPSTITKLASSSSSDPTSKCPLKSEFDCHCHELLQQASVRCHTLNTLGTVNMEHTTNIVTWWVAHSNEYPTLACIAMDVCAIPATSIPCECLFSAGAKVAIDCRSRLGADKFEQLQMLKHTWHNNVVNTTRLNLSTMEEEYLDGFWELLKRDVELVEWDSANETDIL